MKQVVSLFIISLFFQISQAQEEKFSPTLGIGLHAGYNYANMRFDPTINERAVQLPNLGFILSFENERYLGVQFELNFSQQGWEEGKDSSLVYTRICNYLEIPVLAKFNYTKDFVTLGLNFGPYVSFLRGWTGGYEVPESDDSLSHYLFAPLYDYPERYTADYEHNFDLGFMVGVFFGIHSGFGDFHLQGRVTQGVVNMLPRYPEGEFKFSQTRTLYLGVAYIYNFRFSKE